MTQNITDDFCDDRTDVSTLATDPLRFGLHGSVGLSAGDLRSAVLKEVDRLLDENRGHPVETCKSGLNRLAEAKLISQEEVMQLGKICNVVFDRQRNKLDIDDASRKIDAIYHPLIVKGDASPVALAIASMTATIELPKGKSLSAAATGQGGDIGMVGGAIAGAIVGGAIGGAGGAIIGAVVGGIAGGVAGACTD